MTPRDPPPIESGNNNLFSILLKYTLSQLFYQGNGDEVTMSCHEQMYHHGNDDVCPSSEYEEVVVTMEFDSTLIEPSIIIGFIQFNIW